MGGCLYIKLYPGGILSPWLSGGGPNIYNSKMWVTFDHWQHYAENIFSFEVEKETFALKPMNCPGHWCVCVRVRMCTCVCVCSVCVWLYVCVYAMCTYFGWWYACLLHVGATVLLQLAYFLCTTNSTLNW